jgi:hypothetical protein
MCGRTGVVGASISFSQATVRNKGRKLTVTRFWSILGFHPLWIFVLTNPGRNLICADRIPARGGLRFRCLALWVAIVERVISQRSTNKPSQRISMPFAAARTVGSPPGASRYSPKVLKANIRNSLTVKYSAGMCLIAMPRREQYPSWALFFMFLPPQVFLAQTLHPLLCQS